MLYKVHFVPSAERERWQHRFVEVMAQESRQSTELPLYRSDGSTFQARLDCLRVTADDQSFALRIALTDISELKNAQQAMEAHNSQLEALVATRTAELQKSEARLLQAAKMEALGRLSGGIAHDFNNLLTVILGYSDTSLQLLPADDPLYLNLEQIRLAGQRAEKLTQQLLAFSRKQVLQPKVLDLNQAVVAITTLLRRILGEDIHILVRATPGLWPVKADPDKFAQVILNLAINARDAMPQGGTLSIKTDNLGGSADPHPGAPAQVRLSVSDTGVGMDEATISHLFEPFFTTKSLGRGTGLGLATVYGIVQQSGGSVRVHSTPGRGSTFEVYLPRVDAEPTPPPAVQPAPILRGGETILLVEDEDQGRKVVRLMLTSSGYRVIEAGDGQEALRILEAQSANIALVLTDVVMPRMGGRRLAENILLRWPDKRVLYISGYTNEEVWPQGIATIGFVQKPLTADTLVRKVRELLATPTRRTAT